MISEDLFPRFRTQYGEEYARFLRAAFGDPSSLCPHCQRRSLRKLWVGDPRKKLGSSIWGKWYLWCDSCMQGIYCPLGTYAVPQGEPYIQWGDKVALSQALPAGLQLINPVSSSKGKKER